MPSQDANHKVKYEHYISGFWGGVLNINFTFLKIDVKFHDVPLRGAFCQF